MLGPNAITGYRQMMVLGDASLTHHVTLNSEFGIIQDIIVELHKY